MVFLCAFARIRALSQTRMFEQGFEQGRTRKSNKLEQGSNNNFSCNTVWILVFTKTNYFTLSTYFYEDFLTTTTFEVHADANDNISTIFQGVPRVGDILTIITPSNNSNNIPNTSARTKGSRAESSIKILKVTMTVELIKQKTRPGKTDRPV